MARIITERNSGVGIMRFRKKFYNYAIKRFQYEDTEGENTADAYGFNYTGDGFIRSFYYDENNLYIPRGRIDEFKDQFEINHIERKTEVKRETYYDFDIDLWEDKLEVIKKLKEYLGYPGLTLYAEPAFGKTIVALKYIYDCGHPALILTHRTNIAQQWVLQIKDIMKIDAGHMVKDKYLNKDAPIHVMLIHTVLNRGLPKHIYDDGVLVIDECHHIPADVWQRVFIWLPHRIRLGLTGTLPTGSKKKIYQDHFGHDIVSGKSAKKAKIEIYGVDINLPMASNKYCGFRKINQNWIRQPIISKLHSALANDHGRNDAICAILTRLYDKGYLVMLISHRRAHCNNLMNILPSRLRKKTTIFTGKSKYSITDLRRGINNKGIRLILSTYQKSMEGLDIPELEFLVSATPQRGVKQAMGRLERASKKAKKKIFLDLVDTNIPICAGLYKMRRRYYDRAGYDVSTLDYRLLIEE